MVPGTVMSYGYTPLTVLGPNSFAWHDADSCVAGHLM